MNSLKRLWIAALALGWMAALHSVSGEVDVGLAPAPARLPSEHLLWWRSAAGPLAAVRTLTDWEQRRAEIVRGMESIMGALPGPEKRVALEVQVEEEVDCGGYVSGTMKAIWDNVRALDLLDTLPFVRRGRYGAIGHSLGGHNAVFTAVFEPRLVAVVSSCGVDSYVDYYGGDPALWQPGKGWCQERYMPRLAGYHGRLAEIPFDFAELLGALAPRSVFLSAPLHDSNFRWDSVARLTAAAGKVYELHGTAQNLEVVHPECGHDFPDAMREHAYQLFDRVLR